MRIVELQSDWLARNKTAELAKPLENAQNLISNLLLRVWSGDEATHECAYYSNSVMRICLTMTTAGWGGERDPLEQRTLTSHMTHQDIKVINH